MIFNTEIVFAYIRLTQLYIYSWDSWLQYITQIYHVHKMDNNKIWILRIFFTQIFLKQLKRINFYELMKKFRTGGSDLFAFVVIQKWFCFFVIL